VGAQTYWLCHMRDDCRAVLRGFRGFMRERGPGGPTRLAPLPRLVSISTSVSSMVLLSALDACWLVAIATGRCARGGSNDDESGSGRGAQSGPKHRVHDFSSGQHAAIEEITGANLKTSKASLSHGHHHHQCQCHHHHRHFDTVAS